MPPVDSQKLSQLAGKPVAINLLEGETLEQAEARILRDHAQDFQPKQAENFGQGLESQPQALTNPQVGKSISLPQEITQIRDYANQFPPTSKQYKSYINQYESARDDWMKLNPSEKKNIEGGGNIPPNFIDDIKGIKTSQDRLRKLMELKNSGFGGEGIDTGPIVGGAIPLPFTDAEIPFVPAGLSEFINKKLGYKESSSDRGRLRQEILSLLNPVRKEVTGAAAPQKEISQYILPSVPNETDNDQTFFQKGIESMRNSQADLINLIDTLKKSGKDVSGFEADYKTSPDQAVESFVANLLKNQNGSFAREFPEKLKSSTQNSNLRQKYNY